MAEGAPAPRDIAVDLSLIHLHFATMRMKTWPSEVLDKLFLKSME